MAPDVLRGYNVPGLTVALIQKDNVVWMKAYGFAYVASAKPITADTVFNVGSMSKTAYSMECHASCGTGGVDLDRPVDVYLKR